MKNGEMALEIFTLSEAKYQRLLKSLRKNVS